MLIYLCLCLWLSRSWATEEQVSASFTISLSLRNRLFSGYFLSSASSSNTFSSIRSENRDERALWGRVTLSMRACVVYVNACNNYLSCFSDQLTVPHWPFWPRCRRTGHGTLHHTAWQGTPPHHTGTYKHTQLQNMWVWHRHELRPIHYLVWTGYTSFT